MNIKFLDIKITGFFSIDTAEVKLTDAGFTLVTGINNCPADNASKNGIGKSTIPEAIIFALTGETSRGTKAVVNKFTDTGTCVELNFMIDNDTYKIIRYREHAQYGTTLKFYRNGEDKSGKGIRDTEKILAEHLPDLNAQLLGSVIILGQGLPQRFTDNTPSGRKEILEKLSKSDFMIEDIKTKLSDRKATLNKEIREAEDNILTLSSKQSMLTTQLASLQQTKLQLKPETFYDKDIATYQEQLQDASTNIEFWSAKTKVYQSEVDMRLQSYQTLTSQLEEAFSKQRATLEEELKEPQSQLNQINIEISLKSKEIIRLQSIKDVCPTCGQKLPGVQKVDTSSLQAEVAQLKTNGAKIEESIKQQSNQIDIKLKELRDNITEQTEAAKADGKQVREKLNEATTKLQEFNSLSNNIKLQLEKLQLEKAANDKALQNIDIEITTMQSQADQLSKDLLYNNTAKANLESHLDIISKMLTIATRDFRGYLLAEVITYISAKVKEYAQAIFNNQNLEFKLDGNDIYIAFEGKPYEALSGGEKQKVDLIIQFSIRDMLSDLLDFSSNILVLDEIFDSLDAISCQQVIEALTTKLIDVESIFIITHHGEELSIPCDNEIILIKNEKGVSHIQNG